AAQGPSAAAPPLRAPQLPASDVGRPGRAAGRLPDWVAPGAALAAATARALAVRHGPSDPDDDSSEDDDPDSVLPRPDPAERAACCPLGERSQPRWLALPRPPPRPPSTTTTPAPAQTPRTATPPPLAATRPRE
ncbi:hypothetical protein PF010_g11907, partial [Phytophthora fragariae]